MWGGYHGSPAEAAGEHEDERVMSLDNSLKTKGNLTGKRSVMTRAERVQALSADRRFDPKKDKVLGLPKTKPVE